MPLLTMAAVLGFALLARLATVDGEALIFAGCSLPDLCPARWWDGRCPGCGITRAGVLLAQGAGRAAWQMHPGAFVLLGVVLLESSAMLWRPRTLLAARWVLVALLVLVSVGHWISWTLLS